MRPTAAGIYPNYIRGSPALDPQVLAATPLGKDATGANLTAYIVRSDDEAPSPRAKNLANTNNAASPPAADFSNTLNDAALPAAPSQATTATFIKPDSLLTRLEKAQVDQLRARDAAVKQEVADSQTAAAPSFVYKPGPDGKNYIVGVATPLVLQNPDENAENAVPPRLTEQQHDKGIAAYQKRLGTSPLRATRADEAF